LFSPRSDALRYLDGNAEPIFIKPPGYFVQP
jgi:hypothetical protein